MSAIGAATSGQVRYVATLALRAGFVPALTSLTQPTITNSAAQQLKLKYTRIIHAATLGANGQLPPTDHQMQLLSLMAIRSGVKLPTPPNRQVADQWAIAWFKKANADAVANLLSGMQSSQAAA